MNEINMQNPFGAPVFHIEETASTNADAKILAAQGALHGTVIVADRQTAGRGRLGKSFHSPEGGLYLSIILRNAIPESDLMAVTACTAAAVFEALSDFGIRPKIKWVNDLFLNDRKICGILCEGGFDPISGNLDYLIIGIGLNLHPDAHLPEELVPIITDIQSETGIILDKNALASAILRHLQVLLSSIAARTFLPIYTQHSYTIGKQVVVSRKMSGNVSRETQGLAVGYSRNAGLIVRFPDGEEQEITTGTAQCIHT